MTRIDHAARSRRRMEATLSSYETGEDAGAIVVALAALNDSTLALVEQQRIANLIALASMAEDDSKHEVLAGELGNAAVWTLATTKMIGPDDEIEVIDPTIAAALGIEIPQGATSDENIR